MKSKLGATLAVGLGVKLALVAGVVAVGCQGSEEAVLSEESAARSPLEQRIEAFADELELDQQQRARIDNVRTTVREQHEAMREEREEDFEQLVTAIEAGEVDEQEVQSHIDAKIDQFRTTAHQVASELVALVNSMDSEQRTELVTRLEHFHERARAFHERMEAGGGPHVWLRDHFAHPPWSDGE